MTNDEYARVLSAVTKALLVPALEEMFAQCDQDVMAVDLPVGVSLLVTVALGPRDRPVGPTAHAAPAAKVRPRPGRKPGVLTGVVVRVLDAAGGPMSLDAVEEELRRQGREAPRSTIYDTLERLAAAGVIRKCPGGGYEVPPE